MGESTLSLKKADFESKVGFDFGWGFGDPLGVYDDDQKQAIVTDCVESGLRQFYTPPPIDGVPYDWSFLKPTATLYLASGNSTIDLPGDFGGFEGRITITTSSSRVLLPMRIVNEGIVREQFAADPDASGPPMFASVEWLKGTTVDGSQRAQLYVFPAADQAYTLQVPYYILGDYLTGTRPYALGGAAHAETILESCLAIAEQRYRGGSAIHSAKFMERLAASVAQDRRLKPQSGGRNTDLSDGMDGYRQERGDVVVTYNGVEW